MVPGQKLKIGAPLFLRGPRGGGGAQGTTQNRLDVQHTCLPADSDALCFFPIATVMPTKDPEGHSRNQPLGLKSSLS